LVLIIRERHIARCSSDVTLSPKKPYQTQVLKESVMYFTQRSLLPRLLLSLLCFAMRS
jgi:hypothetical protein